jgi:PAS domain S-box-containing protein
MGFTAIVEAAARHFQRHGEPAAPGAETPVACLDMDGQGLLQRVNRSACALLGYREAQMAGYPFWHFLPAEDRDSAQLDLLRKISGGAQLLPYERPFLRRDGGQALVEVREELIYGEGRAVAGLRAWLLDVGARRQRERALARRVEELTKANAALSQFAMAAAHDLSEPLRMVAAYTTLLRQRYKGHLDSDGGDFLTLASEGAGRMQRLLDGLLAYSVAGSSDQPAPPFPVEEALLDAVANLGALIAESGAVVRHGPMPTLAAHPGQLAQIFQNLISNAIKYRSEAPPEVEIACEETGAEWRFSVSDNGVGVDPRDASRIFEPLQRVNPEPGRPGCGLGLAIVRRVVESLGGRIWVLARHSAGATFYFTVRKPEVPRHG